MIKVGIKIMPRDVILDSQGRAVEQSLKANGFSQLSTCRVGKFLEIEINSSDSAAAKSIVEKMMIDGGLFNPLIEKFELNFES